MARPSFLTISSALAAALLLTVQIALAGSLTRESQQQTAAARTAAPAQSSSAATTVNRALAAPARHLLDAGEADRNARKVKQDIQWSNSLADAKQRAQEQGKLVFWVHMLGKLDGAT